MPLAFDFTSTLVIGVTLPVATTLLAKSPFSTLASFEGSILVPPLFATITPTAINSTITATTLPQMISLRRFFLPLVPFPFTTPPLFIARWRLGAIAPSLPTTCLELRLFLILFKYDCQFCCEISRRRETFCLLPVRHQSTKKDSGTLTQYL